MSVAFESFMSLCTEASTYNNNNNNDDNDDNDNGNSNNNNNSCNFYSTMSHRHG